MNAPREVATLDTEQSTPTPSAGTSAQTDFSQEFAEMEARRGSVRTQPPMQHGPQHEPSPGSQLLGLNRFTQAAPWATHA